MKRTNDWDDLVNVLCDGSARDSWKLIIFESFESDEADFVLNLLTDGGASVDL